MLFISSFLMIIFTLKYFTMFYLNVNVSDELERTSVEVTVADFKNLFHNLHKSVVRKSSRLLLTSLDSRIQTGKSGHDKQGGQSLHYEYFMIQ
jgi:hypothetical protein